jgi:hypothetical protein
VPRVHKQAVPDHALHAHYAREGAYTDCYATVVAGACSHAQFVEAFYTTWLFKLERWILARAVKQPSTDEEARALARGERQQFAAWSVEARAPDQLLMCDFMNVTRSWLMVAPDTPGRTRLYFGSVVTAHENPATGRRELGRNYRLLMGFHKLYSRALLAAARSRVGRLRPPWNGEP